MALFKRKSKKKVCVIGLDGVPRSLLYNLSQKGIMPTFAEIIASGHLHELKASLPEISSVSWTDFMTGTNAGKHGIFGFTDFKSGSYDLRFPNFLDVKTPTLWDRLALQKKISIVINQPSTYPARKINGTLISGFVAIELSKAVFPPMLKEQLEKINYAIDIDISQCRSNHDLLWNELTLTLQSREKAWNLLWKEDWDYFEFVITGTDRLQHFLWDAYEDETHPYHTQFLDYYHQVDHLTGKIISAFRELTGGDEGLYLLSDHGFCGIKQEVHLNAWLEKEGYLSFSTPEPKSLNDITPESRAFALDPNRIYLNLKDKFPRGCVQPADKAGLKNEIQTKLSHWELHGEKIVQEVFDIDKIYTGPQVLRGPDLIALGVPGFDMKGTIKKKELFGRTVLQGMHSWDNAFFWANRDVISDPKISDLAKIILGNFK